MFNITGCNNYDEFLRQTAIFNKRLHQKRIERIPFIDMATNIAQIPAIQTLHYWDRMPGRAPHQLCAYNATKWRRLKRSFSSDNNNVSSLNHNGSEFGNNMILETNINNNNSSVVLNDLNNLDENDSFNFDSDDTYSDAVVHPQQFEGNHRRRGRRGRGSTRLNGSRSLRRRATLEVSTVSATSHLDALLRNGCAPSSYNNNNYSYNKARSTNITAAPSKHKPAAFSRLTCKICGKSFSNLVTFNHHVTSVHDNLIMPDKIRGNGLQAPNDAIFGVDDAVSDEDSVPPPILQCMLPNSLDNQSDSKIIIINQQPSCHICKGVRDNLPPDGGLNDINFKRPTITCSDCGKVAHYLCLEFTTKMRQKSSTYNWQCIDCRHCWICSSSENDDTMLFCDECDRGFHYYCLKPPLPGIPEGSWICKLCVD